MMKKALVTGSAAGIGRAIALDLASKGFDVAIHYRNSETEAHQVCQEAAQYNIKAIALQADVTDPKQAQHLVKTAATELNGLSVVVNNVGNYIYKPISQISIDEWHHLLDSNLNSTFYVTQAAIPFLKLAQGGRIVNFAFASAQHVIAHKLNGAYAVSKTGIIVYSKSLAVELIPDHITVNVVSPGAAENTVGLEDAIPLIPAQRPATLAEICQAVAFFVNSDNGYITGQVLEVAGGLRL
ncbi:MAG TPA: bifunctional dihydropteridine reductase/dihydrofolate reductase TmpR [Nodularia sp. (in: cyanobacteria)]|nr:bifunctional dihydropteridine reductase/dihydrofolate reductase TmpR [Nodularia sp. (in: cyanobacteria)]